MNGFVINAVELTGCLSEDYLTVSVILFYKEHKVQNPLLWVLWSDAHKILDQGSTFPSKLCFTSNFTTTDQPTRCHIPSYLVPGIIFS